MTNFALLADAISTKASQPRAIAGTELVVASAAGMPNPTGGKYFRITVVRGTPATPVTVLKVTAVSGTTLTIAGALDGYADAAVETNDVLIATCTAGTFADLEQAVNALEAGPAVGAPLQGATDSSVVRTDANGKLLADGNLTWNATNGTLGINNTAAVQAALAAGPIALIPDYGGVPRISIGGTGFTLIAVARAATGSTFTLSEVYGSTTLAIQRADNASGAATGVAGQVTVVQSGTASYVGFSWTVTETSPGSGGGTHTTWAGAGGGTYALDRYARPVATGPTPTVAAGAGAGTGATASVSGNDVVGLVTVNTGTSPAAGTLFTLTYAHARAAAPAAPPLVVPANAAAAACSLFVDAAANLAASFAVGCGAAPAASGTLLFTYGVAG